MESKSVARKVEYKSDALKVAELISDTGGSITGRTRLQKIACLLELAGLGDGFKFEYRYYGPYSEELSNAVINARSLGIVQEKEVATDWGGFYSIYSTNIKHDVNALRHSLASLAANASSVQLELAATAAFLASEGVKNAWDKTARLKPEKAKTALEAAKKLYSALRSQKTPRELPKIQG